MYGVLYIWKVLNNRYIIIISLLFKCTIALLLWSGPVVLVVWLTVPRTNAGGLF